MRLGHLRRFATLSLVVLVVLVAGAASLVEGVSPAAEAEDTGDRDRRLLPAAGTSEIIYVALGDSTVEGIGATSAATNYPSRIAERLRAHYPQTRLYNLGVAGATAGDVVATQLERAVALRPALVTLSIGPNDVTLGVAAEEYARNVDRILRTLHDRTSAVTVVNLLPDLAITPRFASSPRRAEVGRRAAELNTNLAVAARRVGAEIVDLYTYSRSEVPRHPELVASDGYHPSDAGYARWAEVMWESIARRMPAARR
jgi:acyl-CoA thioesterase-1